MHYHFVHHHSVHGYIQINTEKGGRTGYPILPPLLFSSMFSAEICPAAVPASVSRTLSGVIRPGVTLPAATLPGVILAGVTLPAATLPGVILPGVTLSVFRRSQRSSLPVLPHVPSGYLSGYHRVSSSWGPFPPYLQGSRSHVRDPRSFLPER